MRLKILIIGILASFCSAMSYGQAVAVLEESELLMGTVTTLNVTVPVSNDSVKVEFPLLKDAEARKQKYVGLVNDTVEMLVKHRKSLEDDGELYKIRYELYIQAFDSGKYVIPPLEFLVGSQPVKSNPVELTVLPVKVKADDKIDDFTGVAAPFDVNPDLNAMQEEGEDVLLWWLLASLVLLILAGGAAFLYKRNGKIFPSVRQLSPSKMALDRLQKLKTKNLPEKGKTKEYYTKLSDILRVYLKKQFGIKTSEKTSAEILMQIEADKDLAGYESMLKSILETADFVKFAKVTPSEVENARCMQEAVNFVNESRPEEKPEERKGGKK